MAAFEPPAAPNALIVRPLASRGYAASTGWVAAVIAVPLVQTRFALLREALLPGALLAGSGLSRAIRYMLAPRRNVRKLRQTHHRDLPGCPESMKAARLS